MSNSQDTLRNIIDSDNLSYRNYSNDEHLQLIDDTMSVVERVIKEQENDN